MTKAERHRRYEAGQCTGLRCRQIVEPGHGEQYVNPDGTLDRLCRRCSKKRNETLNNAMEGVKEPAAQES